MKKCHITSDDDPCPFRGKASKCHESVCPASDLNEHSVVYLSGPMSGYHEYNHQLFHEAAKFLTDRFSVKVINPADNYDGSLTWEEVMKIDLDCIRNGGVTHIVLIAGWNHSTGAIIELGLAIELKIKIMIYDELVVMAAIQ